MQKEQHAVTCGQDEVERTDVPTTIPIPRAYLVLRIKYVQSNGYRLK